MTNFLETMRSPASVETRTAPMSEVRVPERRIATAGVATPSSSSA